MLRRALLPLVLGSFFMLPGSAPAAGQPFLSATPNPVAVGDTLVIRGRQWPVIEFCARRVRLSLRSDQNEVVIGFKRIRTNGRFRRDFVVSGVGPGRWRVFARLRCESGEDGSPNFIRRRVPIRVV
jgi:hypothetical protein